MGGSPTFPVCVTPSHNCLQLCDYAQMPQVQGHFGFSETGRLWNQIWIPQEEKVWEGRLYLQS